MATVSYSRGRFDVTLPDGRQFVSNRFDVCWPLEAHDLAHGEKWAAMIAVSSDDRYAVSLAIQDAGYRKRFDREGVVFDTKPTMKESAVA